jgi:hypothetical protein
VSETPRGLNGRGLSRHYGELDPAERFRLVLAAGARGDDRECERLVTTCPRFGYKMSDAAYLDRVEASDDMAVAVALDLAPRMAQLRMLAVTSDLVARAMGAGAALADEEAGAAVEDAARPVLVKTFDAAAEQVRAEAAAVYEAFGQVCRSEMGLEPETVLRAHLYGPYLETLGLDQLEGAKPDKTTVRQWRDMFERKWRRRLGD